MHQSVDWAMTGQSPLSFSLLRLRLWWWWFRMPISWLIYQSRVRRQFSRKRRLDSFSLEREEWGKKGKNPFFERCLYQIVRGGGQKRRHELSKQALQWTMPKKELRREADEILIVTPPSTSLRSTPRENHACLFDQGGRKVICFPPPSFPSHVAKIAKIKREEGEMIAHSSEIAKCSQLPDPCKYE